MDSSNKIVKKDFISSLINVMRNSEFRNFYDENCREPYTWSDIEVIIFYMKLVEFIEIKYKEKHGRNPSKDFLYNSVQAIINNNDSRKLTLSMFDSYKAGNIPKITSLSQLTQK